MRKNNYDEIRIENLEFFANHGVYPEETRLGQKFMISLTMYTDTRRAGRTDELESSTNYGEVSHFIVDFMAKHTCKLIEAAAEKLAEALLLTHPAPGRSGAGAEEAVGTGRTFVGNGICENQTVLAYRVYRTGLQPGRQADISG